MEKLPDYKFYYPIIEAAFKRMMQAVVGGYCRLMSVDIRFGYSFQCASKDFIREALVD